MMANFTFTSSNNNNNGDVHARAFNLARRYSARNENDLMQESFVECDDDGDNGNNQKGGNVSPSYCDSLLQQHLPPGYEMPTECMRYSSFRQGLIRRESRRYDEDVAFAGMDAHARLKAMSAREHNLSSPAQIKRRLTSQSPKEQAEPTWF